MENNNSPFILFQRLFLSVMCLDVFNAFAKTSASRFLGNELDQFYHYTVATKAVVNESHLFEQYDKCEKSTIPERGFRAYLCRYDIRIALSKERKHLWDHLKDKKYGKRYQKDCSYVMSTPYWSSSNSTNHLLKFMVNQYDCNSRQVVPKGGSTFEVFAISDRSIGYCGATDHFNDSYTMQCHFPPDHLVPSAQALMSTDNHMCVNISVILQFEHFDAFSDIGETEWASLATNVVSTRFCSPSPPSPSTSITTSLGAGYWSRPYVVFKGMNRFDLPTSAQSHSPNQSQLRGRKGSASSSMGQSQHGGLASGLGPADYPPTNDYQFRAGSRKYPTVSAIKRCLKKRTIFFAGESHMRYQFDITMDRYVDRLRVGRYHGNMNISGISYIDMTFSARMVRFLDSQMCDPGGDRVTYVLQTGSWDLQFFAPRGFIRNPSQGPGLVEAVRRLMQRSSHCASQVTVVYMTTMPHPWCKPIDSHCIRLMNYWRNNGAIRAANQYMTRALLSLGYGDRVTVLDTLPVLMPRFPFDEFVCVDHFMCNDPPRGLVTIPSGVALATEVINAACADDVTDVSNDSVSGSLYRDGQRLQTQSSEQHTTRKYFTVEQGCRREIPDAETLHGMAMLPESFDLVSEAFIADIPTCHRPQYPSRQSGILYQVYSSRSVFVMDGGVKRQINGAAVLSDLGLTFDNVTFILEEDFVAIPNGKPLLSRAECKHCSVTATTSLPPLH